MRYVRGLGKLALLRLDIILLIAALSLSVWWLDDYVTRPVAKWQVHKYDDGYVQECVRIAGAIKLAGETKCGN